MKESRRVVRESNATMPLVKMSLNQVNRSVTKLTRVNTQIVPKLELSKSLMLLTKSTLTLKGIEHEIHSQEFNSDLENLSHHSLAGSVKEMLGKFMEDLQELCTEFKLQEPILPFQNTFLEEAGITLGQQRAKSRRKDLLMMT
jgi:hypothetical protein